MIIFYILPIFIKNTYPFAMVLLIIPLLLIATSLVFAIWDKRKYIFHIVYTSIAFLLFIPMIFIHFSSQLDTIIYAPIYAIYIFLPNLFVYIVKQFVKS